MGNLKVVTENLENNTTCITISYNGNELSKNYYYSRFTRKTKFNF